MLRKQPPGNYLCSQLRVPSCRLHECQPLSSLFLGPGEISFLLHRASGYMSSVPGRSWSGATEPSLTAQPSMPLSSSSLQHLTGPAGEFLFTSVTWAYRRVITGEGLMLGCWTPHSLCTWKCFGGHRRGSSSSLLYPRATAGSRKPGSLPSPLVKEF